MLRLLRKLRRDGRGVAVAEFAIWVAVFFIGVLAALDFGKFYMDRGELSDALSAATVQAFQTRENVDFAAITTTARNLSRNQSLTVASLCNGVAGSCTNGSRTCACLRTDGSYAPADCGSTCSGNVVTGSTAGYYLTITASRDYQPALLPKGMLAGADIRQTATVRLQ